MGLKIEGWQPKFIRQDVEYRAGNEVKADRINELYNLLIDQGDHNTETLLTLMANFEEFDASYTGMLDSNREYHDEILNTFNSTIAQINATHLAWYNDFMAQLQQTIGDAVYGYASEAYVNNYVSGVRESIIEQTAQAITLTVSDVLQQYSTTTEMMSQIQQEADRIRLTVQQSVSNLNDLISLNASNITQTASNIRAEVVQMLKQYPNTTLMQSAINQAADSITTTVSEQINGMNARLTQFQQTIDGFKMEVNADVNGIAQAISSMQMTANKISWLVKGGTSASNFTLTDRLIALVAQEITILGEATFAALADPDNITVINGGFLTSTHIEATTGEIAGFFFSNEDVYGGLIYNNPENGKYIRFSPYSSHTGGGEYNTNYGALDLGMVNDDGAINTLIHLRSDGYARFGLVSQNGVSVRFNDFLRYDASGGEIGTETVLYTQNFQVYKDGTVHINSPDIPKALTGITISNNQLRCNTKQGLTIYNLIKDEQGRIIQIQTDDRAMDVEWL